MATRVGRARHLDAAPAPRRALAGRASRVASDAVVALALLVGATVTVALLLLLVVLAAPLAAGAIGWLAWRSGDGAARRARRVRARLRRRARALGLVVLAGSQLRLATGGPPRER